MYYQGAIADVYISDPNGRVKRVCRESATDTRRYQRILKLQSYSKKRLLIFLKFYIASPDLEKTMCYKSFHSIQIGIVGESYKKSVDFYEKKEYLGTTPEIISYRRALGLMDVNTRMDFASPPKWKLLYSLDWEKNLPTSLHHYIKKDFHFPSSTL